MDAPVFAWRWPMLGCASLSRGQDGTRILWTKDPTAVLVFGLILVLVAGAGGCTKGARCGPSAPLNYAAPEAPGGRHTTLPTVKGEEIQRSCVVARLPSGRLDSSGIRAERPRYFPFPLRGIRAKKASTRVTRVARSSQS
jgi:hypothetical protein